MKNKLSRDYSDKIKNLIQQKQNTIFHIYFKIIIHYSTNLATPILTLSIEQINNNFTKRRSDKISRKERIFLILYNH